MTRIILELSDAGVLSLHHDAGQVVVVELMQRDHGRLLAVEPHPSKAVASNTVTTVARVVPAGATYRLESES
jgi:hypothetical protein